MSTDLVTTRDHGRMLNLVDALDRRLPELEGQTNQLAQGMAQLTELIDGLRIIQKKAGKMLADSMPITAHGNPVPTLLLEELGLMIERVNEGGQWTDINWPRAIRDIISASVQANDGELDMNQVAVAIGECIGFSYLKEDIKKKTGLARFGLTRATYGRKVDTTYSAKVKR